MQLSSIADFGILNTMLVDLSCAMVMPPYCLMTFMPSAPSLPMPVRITPIVDAWKNLAAVSIACVNC